MQIKLEYGTTGLTLDVPKGCQAKVVDIKSVEPLADPRQAVVESLEDPIEARPLAELAKGCEAPCIVVSDMTRAVPNKIILPPILDALRSAGIERDRITILIGTGLHRPMTDDEITEMLGEDIVGKYRIVNHFAKDLDTNIRLGETSRGTPIWLDKTYVQSDLRILTGLVEPHVMAGYSGGPKAVGIGLSYYEAIRGLHAPKVMEDECTEAGMMEGNLLQHDFREITAKASPDFIVNVTLNRGMKTTGVFSGEMTQAHQRAIEFIESYSRVEVDRRFDVVVTTNGGAPLDINFYQCIKGMLTAARIVKNRGTIVMAAKCPEGLGSDEFAELMTQFECPKEAMEMLMHPNFFVIDQWGVEMICKAMRQAEVLFYSEGIAEEILKRCLVTPISSVNEGLRLALEKHGGQAEVAVIPKGPYIVAEVR